ncbi:hypothetical protein SPI_07565 [Niveomyces insectorum RCEF 264]|uniref:Uncharacterized protein n=1 Tax=Niveomyces insectorum RCEF 264 TaxID=1081102 RepID=A0A167PDN7_9HYPO|nr:hypothetical protein SPI_07565 [Niveomyces insectorum RCEF 264]
MNRFRTKKKVKEDPAAAVGRVSSEEQHTSAFKGFRRTKKPPEEEKKNIDLTNALPPSDDFRTSLLMTGLSARFSMLREQDDPNTKIGKASDDSVLYPKRRSGMMDWNFRGLDDIAEVESIKAPPSYLRTNSYASDSESGPDSIMNRTRPTDGNNLFGGRQKIYRIPVGATKGGGEGGMGGRALYEDDVAFSAFQKLRQKDKHRFADLDEEANTASNTTTTTSTTFLSADNYDSSSSFPRSESPSPVDYNLRRETSSTTSSGTRNSTAATSVASQSAKDWQFASQASSPSLPQQPTTTPSASTPTMSTATRIRRLYEQGLTQDLHEHQSSALSRMETLSGKLSLRSRTPDLAQTTSSSPTTTFGFNERAGSAFGTVNSTLERLERRQASAKTSASNLRSTSPPVSGSSAASSTAPARAPSLRTATSMVDTRRAYATVSPPLSPPVSESVEHHPSLPIQPSDRGKATAMGMFQKPSLPYDESRFAQRQLQLQQGRETPTERVSSDNDASHATGRSSRSSSTTRQPQPQPRPSIETFASANSKEEATKASKTFLFDDDEEEVDRDSIAARGLRPQVALQRPSDSEHPAFRQSALPTPLSLGNADEVRPPHGIAEEPELPDNDDTAAKTSKSGKSGNPLDSPTLGPGDAGLSGMVRQHLRSTSNASSVYSTMSPQNNGFDAPASTIPTNTSIMGDLGVKANPWDEQDWTASVYSALNGENSAGNNQTPATGPREEQHTANQPLPGSQTQTLKTAPVDAEAKAPSLYSASSRSRLASITDSNRSSNNLDKDDGGDDDFASQLANARRRVQERLTTYVETDSSRNTSPLLAPTEPSTQAQAPPPKSHPLGVLRAKSSRGTIAERSRDASQTKAMKMLGIGSTTMSTTPSPSKQSFDDNSFPATPPTLASVSSIPDIPSLDAHPERNEDKQLHGNKRYFGRDRAAIASNTTTPRRSNETDTERADDELEVNGGGYGNSDAGQAEPKEDETNMHPGLRAFRNARRELQKRRELETSARHQDDASAEAAASADKQQQSSPPRRERRGTQTSPNRDRRPPPPVLYRQREPSQESHGSSGNRSRSNSRTSGPTERDRSGSDTSNHGGSYGRQPPPRIRASAAVGPSHDEHPQNGNHFAPATRQSVPVRSPGLPGTDIRRSPYMPPQGMPGVAGSASSNNLSVQTAAAGRSPSGGGGAYDPASGLPSPISPLGSAGLPTSPYYPGSTHGSGASTPTTVASRVPRPTVPSSANYGSSTSSLNESMKKTVKKNDISEPTFIMSTSRVPTMTLPQSMSAPDAANGQHESRSRSGSRSRAGSNAATSGYAPPLPPINPLRKQSGGRGPRGMFSGLMGRRNGGGGGGGDDEQLDMMGSSMPHLPLASPASSGSLVAGGSPYQFESVSDNEGSGGFEQRTRRKQTSEAGGMHSRLKGPGQPASQMDFPGGMI